VIECERIHRTEGTGGTEDTEVFWNWAGSLCYIPLLSVKQRLEVHPGTFLRGLGATRGRRKVA
jgi:hypothetical protein